MNRRAFLTTLTSAIGTLALAACRNAAPAPTSLPPTATTIAMANTPPPSAAPVASPSLAPSASATPAIPSSAATATRPQPATPGGPPTMTVAPTQPLATPTAGALPLFDTHVHYSQDAWGPIPIPQALALMDLSGTQVAMVSSTPDEGTIQLHQAAPDRIIPILRPYRTRDDMSTWFDDPTIIPYLEERRSWCPSRHWRIPPLRRGREHGGHRPGA